MPGLFDPQLDPSVIEGDGLPLDVSDQRGPAPAASGKTDWKRLAPLLAALPLALKRGGRVGGAALLRGYERARQQSVEEQRRTSADEENRAYRRDSLASLQAQRDATIQNQLTTREQADEAKRQTFFQQFNQAMDGLDNPADVEAQMPLWAARARSLGIAEDPLQFAPTPIALSKRKAAKELERALKGAKDFGLDPATASVRIDGKDVPIRELDGYVNGPKAADTSDAPLDRRYLGASIAAFRETNKREPTPQELQKLIAEAKRVVGQADDRPRINVDIGGLNPREVATFNGIVDKYQRSPLTRAADRTIVLDNAIREIEKDPSNPANQLQLAYSYIQALDTYQSAVREGELQNLGMLGTKLQSFMVTLNKVANEGAFIAPEVAKNIAQNAKQLSTTIREGQTRKQQEFASQARVSGVGAMWDNYVKGAQPAAPTVAAPTGPQPYQGLGTYQDYLRRNK